MLLASSLLRCMVLTQNIPEDTKGLSNAVEEVLIVNSGKYTHFFWRENIRISIDRRKRVKRW